MYFWFSLKKPPKKKESSQAERMKNKEITCTRKKMAISQENISCFGDERKNNNDNWIVE
jgi:hypothetical protein